jgi:hypothetical protein
MGRHKDEDECRMRAQVRASTGGHGRRHSWMDSRGLRALMRVVNTSARVEGQGYSERGLLVGWRACTRRQDEVEAGGVAWGHRWRLVHKVECINKGGKKSC